ncbi:hypothetical protein MHYP_G00300780 [Metynnis hypsauchen]
MTEQEGSAPGLVRVENPRTIFLTPDSHWWLRRPAPAKLSNRKARLPHLKLSGQSERRKDEPTRSCCWVENKAEAALRYNLEKAETGETVLWFFPTSLL